MPEKKPDAGRFLEDRGCNISTQPIISVMTFLYADHFPSPAGGKQKIFEMSMFPVLIEISCPARAIADRYKRAGKANQWYKDFKAWLTQRASVYTLDLGNTDPYCMSLIRIALSNGPWPQLTPQRQPLRQIWCSCVGSKTRISVCRAGSWTSLLTINMYRCVCVCVCVCVCYII